MAAKRTVRACLRVLMSGMALFLSVQAGRADVDVDLRAGWYFDASDVFVGGGALADIGRKADWYFNPNLEYVFVDAGDLFTLNGDFHYDFETKGDYYFWLGAGPAILFADNGDSETDLGVNLLVGWGLKKQGIVPYVQGKFILADESDAAVAVGIRF